MPVTGTICVDSRPLRRVFLKHFDPVYPIDRIFRTDDNGCVTLPTDGNRTGAATVTVLCQNSVVRILDGDDPLRLPVSQDVSFRNGETAHITGSKVPHFRVLQQCLDSYDLGLREFPPYNQEGRGDFPFGGRATLEGAMKMPPRIELCFPDRFPSPLSFVEPASFRTAFPLVHIKDNDSRLFPLDVARKTLITHELTHALHFAFLPLRLRAAIETKYSLWLAKRVLRGQPPFHGAAVVTSPFIAYIEAFPLFLERYVVHKILNPGPSGLVLHQSFFAAERDRITGNVTSLGGSDVEGAVMGALFIDFADSPLTGLGFVVNTYITSRALSFNDFRNFIRITEGADSERSIWLNQVARKWGM